MVVRYKFVGNDDDYEIQGNDELFNRYFNDMLKEKQMA